MFFANTKKCQKSILASVKSERFCCAIWSCSELAGFRSTLPIPSVNDLSSSKGQRLSEFPLETQCPSKQIKCFLDIQNLICRTCYPNSLTEISRFIKMTMWFQNNYDPIVQLLALINAQHQTWLFMNDGWNVKLV